MNSVCSIAELVAIIRDRSPLGVTLVKIRLVQSLRDSIFLDIHDIQRLKLPSYECI
jgi:hypothetical protein